MSNCSLKGDTNTSDMFYKFSTVVVMISRHYGVDMVCVVCAFVKSKVIKSHICQISDGDRSSRKKKEKILHT